MMQAWNFEAVDHSILPFWGAVRSCDALVFLGISAWLDLGIAASGLRSARVVVL